MGAKAVHRKNGDTLRVQYITAEVTEAKPIKPI